MANIRVIGQDRADGFDLKVRTTDGSTAEGNLHNTTMQVLRQRSSMFKEMGFFFLDESHLDKDKIL